MPGDIASTCNAAAFTANRNGKIADDVARRVVGSRRARIVGRAVEHAAARRADEALVRDDRAVDGVDVDADDEDDRRRVLRARRRADGHQTRRRRARRRERDAVDERRLPPAPSATAAPFNVVLPAT